jgi:hypothetical protein
MGNVKVRWIIKGNPSELPKFLVPKADGGWESKIDKYWREARSLKKKPLILEL